MPLYVCQNKQLVLRKVNLVYFNSTDRMNNSLFRWFAKSTEVPTNLSKNHLLHDDQEEIVKTKYGIDEKVKTGTWISLQSS